MSGQLQPYTPRPASETVALTVPSPHGGAAAGGVERGWEPPPPPADGSLKRYLAAVRRYAWLVVLFAIVGAGGGYVASTFIEPEYEVRATILLSRGSGDGGAARGPIQAEEFLATAGFRDLLRSYQVADPVVNDLRLFLTPAKATDSTLFRNFRVDQSRLRPGEYILAIAGGRYTLGLQRGVEVEQGVLGDSVGRTVGFAWQPPAAALAGRASVAFTVVTPREASNTLIEKLRIPETDAAFLKMALSGTDPQRTAATLNAWVRQFEAVSTSLKKKKVSQAARILEGQREFAAQQVAEAEAALQRFRVQTVTEPTERQAIVPGLDMTNNPVFDQYFSEKVLAEGFRRDREALEAVARGAGENGGITREAVLSIPSVVADPAAEDLRKVLQEQADRDAALRRLRDTFQDGGGDVTLASGAVVRPDQVMGQARSGRSVVFSGDTRPCAGTEDAARGADLLVHEATFTDDDAARAVETRHSTAREAAQLAARAGVRMLALTHVSTRVAPRDVRREAQAVFPGVIVPRDFDQVEIPFRERGEPRLIPVQERLGKGARDDAAAPDAPATLPDATL